MHFLIAGGAPRRNQEPGRWGGHVWETAWRYNGNFNLHRVQEHERAETNAKIDQLISDVNEVDGVFCEGSTALILAREWAHRGIKPKCVLALQVHGMEKIDGVRAWYRAQGEDPWPLLAAAPYVSWLAPSLKQEQFLASLVPAQNIQSIRFSASVFELLTSARLETGTRPSPSRTVLFPGNGYRDWPTTLQTALATPDLQCVIIGGSRSHFDKLLARWKVPWPQHVTHLEQVPLEDYIEHVRSAGVVVVPLKGGDGDGGHTTVVLANRLGVPVVCTQSPTLSDYTSADRSCLVTAPEDAPGLAKAIRRALEEPLAQTLRSGGKAFEQTLELVFSRALHAAIAHVRPPQV